MSSSLRPHGLQHTRLPCPSLSPRICSNSSPLSWWYHLLILCPHFSFCPQSLPASESFPMSWLFASGGQSIGALASVLPMNIQGWFPLGLTGLISLQSKGLSRVFSNTTVQKFFGALVLFSILSTCWLICLILFSFYSTCEKKNVITDFEFILWAWILPQSWLEMVPTARANALQMLTTSLLTLRLSFFLWGPLAFPKLSCQCPLSVPTLRQKLASLKIPASLLQSPPPASLPANRNCKVQDSPLLLMRIKSHSLLTQRKEKAASHAKRL